MNDKSISLVAERLKTGSELSFNPGKPMVYKALGVCPVHLSAKSGVEYVTYEEALDEGTVTVSEIGEAGSVPELRLENNGSQPVLIIDGEQLVGAKQNRVLNTTVLVDAHSKAVIPVSCVEQGRWHYETSRRMSGSPVNLYAGTRAMKSRQVYSSLQAGLSYDSDQGSIWNDISSRLHDGEVNSPTSAMNDHYAGRMDSLEEYHQNLALDNFDGAGKTFVGAVFTLSGEIMGMDVFDRASTLDKQWRKLLNSYAIEALSNDGEGMVDADDVHRFFGLLRDSRMHVFDPPGLGDDVRMADESAVGSALVVEDTVLHLYAFKVEDGGSRERENDSGQSTRMSSYSDRVRRRRAEYGDGV